MIQRLRVGNGTGQRIRGIEPAEAVDVVASHGVVVGRFGISLIAGELPLCGGTTGIPRLAEGIMALLADDAAGRVGGRTVGELVGMVIGRGRAGDGGDEIRAGIDVLCGRRAGLRAGSVLADHF